MSGFLTRSKTDEEPPAGDEEEEAEESYQTMFAKLARDFVHKEDMYNILERILREVDPQGQLGINVRDDSFARQRAAEYKDLLDAGEGGTKAYPDIGDE